MYVLSWRTVSVLTWALFWCLFPSLLRNSGNKHQNNPLVSAETVRHSSTYIILYAPKLSGVMSRPTQYVAVTDILYISYNNFSTDARDKFHTRKCPLKYRLLMSSI